MVRLLPSVAVRWLVGWAAFAGCPLRLGRQGSQDNQPVAPAPPLQPHNRSTSASAAAATRGAAGHTAARRSPPPPQQQPRPQPLTQPLHCSACHGQVPFGGHPTQGPGCSVHPAAHRQLLPARERAPQWRRWQRWRRCACCAAVPQGRRHPSTTCHRQIGGRLRLRSRRVLEQLGVHSWAAQPLASRPPAR